ncbi:hypothetical protein C8J56DRAFT_934275 [Mycena floridula]|nr:hypothetical protein C8J56DRAFT_934275 [Mycena floridula]
MPSTGPPWQRLFNASNSLIPLLLALLSSDWAFEAFSPRQIFVIWSPAFTLHSRISAIFPFCNDAGTLLRLLDLCRLGQNTGSLDIHQMCRLGPSSILFSLVPIRSLRGIRSVVTDVPPYYGSSRGHTISSLAQGSGNFLHDRTFCMPLLDRGRTMDLHDFKHAICFHDASQENPPRFHETTSSAPSYT